MMRRAGFTLTELLIALGLLGVIAAFTIPKVLVMQQESGWNANGKTVGYMMQAAYSEYILENAISDSTTLGDFTPYLTYIRRDTTSITDDAYGDGTFNCANAARICLRLDNGGILSYATNVSFGGTTNTHAINYHFDPNGQSESSTQALGKAIPFFIYSDGRVTDRGSVNSPTTNSTNTVFNPNENKVPPWFTWDD